MSEQTIDDFDISKSRIHKCPECGKNTTGYAHIELIPPKRKHRYFWYPVCPKCAIKPSTKLQAPVYSEKYLVYGNINKKDHIPKYYFHSEDDIVDELFTEKAETYYNYCIELQSYFYNKNIETNPERYIHTYKYEMKKGRCVKRLDIEENKPLKNDKYNNHNEAGKSSLFSDLFDKTGCIGAYLAVFVMAMAAALCIWLIIYVLSTVFYWIFLE